MKKLLTALALSTILAGGAAAYADDNAGNVTPPQGMHHHDDMFANLPPQDAQLIHDAMKKAHEDSKPLMAQGKKLHDQLNAILTADQFDQKAFLATDAKIQAVHDKIKAKTSAAFASALAQLPVADRKMIADSMTKRHNWMHGKGHWHQGQPQSADNGAAPAGEPQ